ncbi:TPA: DNA utilization protein HofM [Citrobacter freundii]
MAFKFWQIGLHIQQYEALAVAVSRGAAGWVLQRWWRLPLKERLVVDGQIQDVGLLTRALLSWRRELPHRHRISLSFPASRTLQKRFSHPAMTLREGEQTAWLAATIARELNMDPDALRFDYREDALSPAFSVTAVQNEEIATLLTLAQQLKMQVSSITPDACALQRFIPYLPSHQQGLAWRDGAQWLWATRYAWGRKPGDEVACSDDLAAMLSLAPETLALCEANDFDPWCVVPVRQPPQPVKGHDFAIALGLAIAERD